MGIIFQIALRNLTEHRMKSIIICSLIALGMFLLVLGNSIIDTGKAGIEKAFIKSLSGHILVGPTGKDGQKPVMLNNGMQSMMGGDSVKSIPEYQQVLQLLDTHPEIAALNPQVYGIANIELDEEYRAGAGFFGVDVDAYGKMFPGNLEIVSGRFLNNSEEGILLSEKVWKDIKDTAKIDIKVGDKLKIMGMGMGTKIIYLPVVGISRFKSSFSSMQELCFMDVSSLRYLQGMVVGAIDQIKIADTDQSMLSLSADNIDSMFGPETATTEITTVGADAYSDTAMKARFGDTDKRAALNTADAGAWHYVLLRLQDGTDIPTEIEKLNAEFTAKGWGIQAVNWEVAAGQIAGFVTAAQTFFLILVIIISIVSVIVIMNTLVVSIVERTAEIGTMRALGAQKSYIRLIFTSETLALSVVGGLIGLAVASLLIAILNVTGLPSPNELFDIVFGGKILYPVLSGWSAVQAMVIMVGVGLLSSLYPTAIALKIQPVAAMQSN